MPPNRRWDSEGTISRSRAACGITVASAGVGPWALTLIARTNRASETKTSGAAERHNKGHGSAIGDGLRDRGRCGLVQSLPRQQDWPGNRRFPCRSPARPSPRPPTPLARLIGSAAEWIALRGAHTHARLVGSAAQGSDWRGAHTARRHPGRGGRSFASPGVPRAVSFHGGVKRMLRILSGVPRPQRPHPLCTGLGRGTPDRIPLN